MAIEIGQRIEMSEEKLAVLDLVCYRALLRAVPKLRGLGVIGRDEFKRRMGMGDRPARLALVWLTSLGLARKGEIPLAVVEVCERLRAARGARWWEPIQMPVFVETIAAAERRKIRETWVWNKRPVDKR